MSTDSTLSLEELVQRAAALRERAGTLGDYLDPPTLEKRVSELEAQMGAPGFWDDQANAAAVSSAHAAASGRLSQYRELSDEIGSLAEMADLLREEERAGDPDSDMLGELAEGIARADGVLAGLEEARLFSGEHDAGDAVVQINAGEGGTDAQDWAEMLLRMYLRWAERRGLKADVKEAQEGTEAGLKSVTFTVHGPNAYGLLSAERGVHRLVRLSPFDSANRRQTSFAAVEVGPLVSDAVEVEILDKDLKIDTYRASGAGGQHVNKTDSAVRITHLPTQDRRPVPERALADAEPRDGDVAAARAPRAGRSSSAARPRRPGTGARTRAASGSAARSAPTWCTRTRWSRTSVPATRPATPRASWTATWTGSSGPSWSAAPAGEGPSRRPSRDPEGEE